MYLSKDLIYLIVELLPQPSPLRFPQTLLRFPQTPLRSLETLLRSQQKDLLCISFHFLGVIVSVHLVSQ